MVIGMFDCNDPTDSAKMRMIFDDLQAAHSRSHQFAEPKERGRLPNTSSFAQNGGRGIQAGVFNWSVLFQSNY